MTKFTWGDQESFIFEIKKLKVKFTAQATCSLLVPTSAAQKHDESHSNYQDYIIETCFPLPKPFRKSLLFASTASAHSREIVLATKAYYSPYTVFRRYKSRQDVASKNHCFSNSYRLPEDWQILYVQSISRESNSQIGLPVCLAPT